MKSIFITARYPGDGFENFLGPSLKHFKTKCINVADQKDSTDVKSIARKYTIGVNIAKDNDLLSDDTIIIFAKSNVHIIDPVAIDKIAYIFDSKPNVGVVGVMGVCMINRGRELYDMDNKPVNGIVYQTEGTDKGEHIQYSKNGFYNEVVAVDDSIIAIRGSLLTDDVDAFESDVDSGFGIEATIKALKKGYDTVVADILVVSQDNTNVSHDVVDDVVSKLDVTYPVKSKTIAKRNSVIDIEI